MSTKTTFKRIALVAVAALTLGSLSAVSATAAPSVAYTTMFDTTNGYQVLGGQATVTLTTDTSTVTTVVVSGVGSVVSATAGSNATVVGTPTTGSWSVTTSSGGAGTTTVVLSSTVAGTTTITATPLGSNGAPGTAVTKTVTWAASFATKSVSAANSTSFIGAGSSTSVTADAAVVADKAAGRVATIKVTLLDGNAAAINDLSLSATISGPGLIKASTDGTANGDARATSVTLTGANVGYVAVNSDGTNGVGTITISAGTTVIATETVTFSGVAATYVVAQTRGVYAGTTAPSTPGTQSVTVTVTDAAGNKVVDGTTVYAASATTTVATIGASATTTSGVATFTITGAAAGTSVITFGNAASAATVTATTTVTVGSATFTSVKMTTDKDSYLPGEKITLTVAANSAAGTPVADGVYTLFSVAPASSMALAAGTLPIAGAITLKSGVATYTLNAPVTEGPFTISGTDALTAANVVSVTATVENAAATAAATAAADAAAEATDAANAATDAANAAAEAADAATAAAQDAADAVAALSTQVSEMINALKKQITALTNLVIKIQKKVKA